MPIGKRICVFDCHFNCTIETERLLKVRDSLLHCNISKKVQYKLTDFATTNL